MKINKLKIAIVGYGAMGIEIEKYAEQKEIEIINIFDVDTPLQEDEDYDFDVAIDFSTPDAVLNNIRILSDKKKSVVMGTTGWNSKLVEVKKLVKDTDIGFIWSSNFSIGMSVFQKLTEVAAKLMNNYPEYDVFLHEIHHKRKKDSPSGTAISLAKILVENIDRKKDIFSETCHYAPREDLLYISSSRGGEVTGNHTIYFDSFADSLELTHSAKNRSGFALGALLAAEWIHGKNGFYEFKEIFNIE